MSALFALLISPELAALRREFPAIVSSIVLLLVGLTAGVVFFFRRKTRDLTLVYFGLFCSMYALRLLASQQTIRSFFERPASFWSYVEWIITAQIILPFGLFLAQIATERLRRFFVRLIAIQAAFAAFGIIAASAGFSLSTLSVMNNFVVLGTLAAIGI